MLPILQIGPAAIPTYPLLLLVAFWAGMWLAARRAQQLGLESDHVYNAGLYGLLAGILGARLWFILLHWENYVGDLTQALSLSRSALSPAEGLVVAGLVVLIYLQRHKIPLGLFLDALAPGLALGLLIEPIGDFLGGETLGALSNLPWAITLAGSARHPFQLYQVGSALILLGVLWFGRHWHPWIGFHFWLLLALYSLSRLLLEVFRANPAVMGDGFLTLQVAALATLVVTLAVMAYNFSINRAR
jgi:phosphatidylglycerol:prolipoprotein diacylglycerol transferase